MGYKKKDGTVVTDDWMDTIAEAAEKDRLPGVILSTETHAGRPRMYDDDELKTISFRLPLSRISAIERAAKRKGESRSEFLRDAVDKALIGNAS
jgi:hypothetical protein